MDTKPLTASSLIKGIHDGVYSAVEAAGAYLSNVKASDGELGAFLEVYGEEVLAEAARIDADPEKGKKSLAGVPVALKDNILVKDHRTTAGSKILESYIASYDATVVQKLKRAGAIVIGKTNLDEFAMGSSTERSAFKITKNPHDPSRVPGGSSGGSAAAVAADMALAALGSDTSGSVCLPAAFCGVVGLRPTYGAVSRHGLIAMASSLDQIGPFTRTVEDAEIIFNVIRGHDPLDATSAEKVSNEGPKEKLTIGVPKEFFVDGMDPEVKKGMEIVNSRFRELGFEIKEVSLPHSNYALSVYYLVMPAEVSANLARLDGIRYARIPEATDAGTLRDVYELQRGKGFGEEVRRRILLGTFVLSAGYYDAYYAKAQKVRTLIARDFDAAFKEVDVLLAPVAPTPAFKFGEKLKDPLQMYLSDIFTTQTNLAGIPAISIPVEKYKVGSGKLPIGFQLIAPHFRECDLFSLGKKYDGAYRT